MAADKNQKQDAPREPVRIPKSMFPSGKITHKGRVKTRKEKQEDGTEVEVEVEGTGTVDKQDHEWRRMVPALNVEQANDKAEFDAMIDAYLALNVVLSVKGQPVIIVKADGTEETRYTQDPEDKTDGQVDGKGLIPCVGLPKTRADLVNLINDAVYAAHQGDQNAMLTAKYAAKPAKKAGKQASGAAVPDNF